MATLCTVPVGGVTLPAGAVDLDVYGVTCSGYTLTADRVQADTTIWAALVAVLVVVWASKWLINYLMAGGRDD
jgi:hypothetical protein